MSEPRMGRQQQGVVLLWLLFFVAALGVGTAAIGAVWHTAAQREREAELLFVGDQYRRAIESFWHAPLPQGQERRLPVRLEELLEDPRFPHGVRHLRRIYVDPMTGAAKWGMVGGKGEGIRGVYSLSEARPLKSGGFPIAYAAFEEASSYREWVFLADLSR